MPDKLQLVGSREIAHMLGVELQTVHRWGNRRKNEPKEDSMPEPDWMISGFPVWMRSTIVRWARQTGRLTADGVVVFAGPLTGQRSLKSGAGSG